MESSHNLTDPVSDRGENWPHITVCIPVSNRKSTLLTTLERIDNDSYNKKKMTLIFYDGSTDSSSQILQDFMQVHEFEYSAIVYRKETRPSQGNIAKARNGCLHLARQTEAEYIVSIDSDVAISQGTMKALVGLLQRDLHIGMASIPYTYSSGNSQPAHTPDVDITLGCTIISRELLDRVDWTIDERFAKADDLWLGATAERLGFKLVSYSQMRVTHMKPFSYRDHVRKRVSEVPLYHYLLLKEGLLTRRLRRTYTYYGAYLILPILCLASYMFIVLLAPLLGLGVWHYRSVKRFLRALPVGIVMIVGLLCMGLKDLFD
jgi:glycosyltransferase involved in cell wall biosynthesis